MRLNLISIVRNLINKQTDSFEFRPLLSEIEDAPVSPLGRFTFWVVIVLMFVTILVLFLGKVDIVVSARGVVIPVGESKIIQPLETGVVRQIHIKEGDFVKKGQVLISLDTTSTDAKLKTLNDNIFQSKLETLRLSSGDSFSEVEIDDSDLISKNVLLTQKKIYEENKNVLDNEIQAQMNEIERINMQIKANLIRKRDVEFQLKNSIDRERNLSSVKDIIAYKDYQDVVTKTNSLREAISQIDYENESLRAQIRTCQNSITKLKSSFDVQNLTTLTQLQKQMNDLVSQKEDVEFRNKSQKIIAPCDGYIDKLNVHTIGGVVTPAQEVIVLTPSDVPLLVKANVQNKDVGFVKKGMPVSIKVDTFDFQRYGVLKGSVKSISQNSIEDELMGLVYEVYVLPESVYLEEKDSSQRISAGMTLSAEIEIGKRRIIEFFIYPLIKYLDEGVSVR